MGFILKNDQKAEFLVGRLFHRFVPYFNRSLVLGQGDCRAIRQNAGVDTCNFVSLKEFRGAKLLAIERRRPISMSDLEQAWEIDSDFFSGYVAGVLEAGQGEWWCPKGVVANYFTLLI